MSIIIACPNCGERPIEEFAYGEVPQVPESITDPIDRNFDYGFMRHNTEGVQREAWFHSYGCRRWLYLERDTRNDQIVAQAERS